MILLPVVTKEPVALMEYVNVLKGNKELIVLKTNLPHYQTVNMYTVITGLWYFEYFLCCSPGRVITAPFLLELLAVALKIQTIQESAFALGLILMTLITLEVAAWMTKPTQETAVSF